ncbi:MAG: AIR synthase-related protein [Bacteroidia bacterium]
MPLGGTPAVKDAAYFAKVFNAVQEAICQDLILAGHDVSSGGLITALLEMCFSDPDVGLKTDLSELGNDLIQGLFAENHALLIQGKDESFESFFSQKNSLS